MLVARNETQAFSMRKKDIRKHYGFISIMDFLFPRDLGIINEIIIYFSNYD